MIDRALRRNAERSETGRRKEGGGSVTEVGRRKA